MGRVKANVAVRDIDGYGVERQPPSAWRIPKAVADWLVEQLGPHDPADLVWFRAYSADVYFVRRPEDEDYVRLDGPQIHELTRGHL